MDRLVWRRVKGQRGWHTAQCGNQWLHASLINRDAPGKGWQGFISSSKHFYDPATPATDRHLSLACTKQELEKIVGVRKPPPPRISKGF